MSIKLGQYIVAFGAQHSGDGRYTGTANLVWGERDITREKQLHFRRAFNTEAEAKTHARYQVEVRHKDGKL